MHKIMINKKIVLAEDGAVLSDVIKASGIAVSFPCGGNGLCGRCKVTVNSGTLPPVSDAERRFLSETEIGYHRRLACFLTVKNNLEVTVFETESTSVLPAADTAAEASKNLALAADIGTTTVVLYLIDLSTGKIMHTMSALNAQGIYGGDVLSRMQYARENGGGEKLRAAVVGQLNEMIQVVADKKPIAALSIAANTVMTHFLLGLPTETMAAAPFTPVTTATQTPLAGAIGLSALNADCPVTVPGGISAFVGGDVVAGLLDCGMALRADLSLFVDLGTNGEIVLGNKNGLLCCATAVGPAFEGGQIRCGAGGIAGAVNRFGFENGEPFFTTIGDKPPVGICGSGLLDLIGALRKTGLIDETGYLFSSEKIAGEAVYMLTDDIYLTQSDIRAVQLAKAAVCAGIKTLLHASGQRCDNIKTVYLAGGFGQYMSVESAATVGLFPEELCGKIQVIGNAAGNGAMKLLRDKTLLKEIEAIKEKARVVMLAGNAFFEERFLGEIGFAIK